MKASEDEKQFCLCTAGLFVIFLLIYAVVYRPEYEREVENFAKAVRAQDMQKAAAMLLYPENNEKCLKLFAGDGCTGYEILQSYKMKVSDKKAAERIISADFGARIHIQKGYFLEILIKKKNDFEKIRAALLLLGGHWYFTEYKNLQIE